MTLVKQDQPLYLQLVDMLELEIKQSMSANDKLLSERDMSKTYNVSRITVRQALKELEMRGLIYKQKGKGTFVSGMKNGPADLATSYSFTSQMKALGKSPETVLLDFEKIDVTVFLSKYLNLEIGTAVFEFERLRKADGQALIFERSYVPCEFCSVLGPELLREKALYTIFAEDSNQVIRQADEEFYASIALDYEAQLLGIKKGDPVLHMIRKTYNQANQLIEFTFSIARADQFHYRITHTPPQ
ncbi:GntR family transcriptional regulator [Streptococcus hongkongensis]|nr:GntR family transcriptional regulator [Streptococcus uberis]